MEKQSSNLPILEPKTNWKRGGKNGGYLVSADLEAKEKHTITGENGFSLDLIIPRESNNNYKDKMPNECVVEDIYGEVDFPVGTTIFIDHWLLLNHDGSSNHMWIDEHGKKYWRIDNHNVYYAIIDGKIVPNSDILICEYLEDKLLDTSLDLSGSLSGQRQDIAKVLISSDDRYPVGSYILVEEYALYEIEFQGKKMAKVELAMDDVIGIVSDPSIRATNILNMNLSEA